MSVYVIDNLDSSDFSSDSGVGFYYQTFDERPNLEKLKRERPRYAADSVPLEEDVYYYIYFWIESIDAENPELGLDLMSEGDAHFFVDGEHHIVSPSDPSESYQVVFEIEQDYDGL